MFALVGFVALILLAFIGYKIFSPKKESLQNKFSMPIKLPDREQVTQRKVAMWLPPCNSRIAGKCGPPLKCCGDFYADNIYIK